MSFDAVKVGQLASDLERAKTRLAAAEDEYKTARQEYDRVREQFTEAIGDAIGPGPATKLVGPPPPPLEMVQTPISAVEFDEAAVPRRTGSRYIEPVVVQPGIRRVNTDGTTERVTDR